MSSRKYRLFSLYKAFAEMFIPVPKNSNFVERGVLTPQEFVTAGDYLVEKCGTWQWATGVAKKKKRHLPADKQFLVTKGVPCLKRCSDLLVEADTEEDIGDGWVATHLDFVKKQASQVVQDISGAGEGVAVGEESSDEGEEDSEEGSEEETDDDDMDAAVDIDAFNSGVGSWDEVEDDAVVAPPAEAEGPIANVNVMKTRTYDLSITYDWYYHTPRVWLFGYDENGRALTTPQILEDIHVDYSNKTVTVEGHPHLNCRVAGIHPCKHASLMKKMIDLQIAANKGHCPRVDLYLFMFLKFISSVIPTIIYDFTVSARQASGQ